MNGQVPEIPPRSILAAISRQCEAQTGTCVMVHDPERDPCSPENCFAVRQVAGWAASGASAPGPLRGTSSIFALRGEPSEYFPTAAPANGIRISSSNPIQISGLQIEQNQVATERLEQLVKPLPRPNGNKPKWLCRLFGHRWKPCHKMQRNQEEHRFEWVYIDHVCTRCYMCEKRSTPNG